ncbi:A/G-specific adenine glycosylase [Pseudidiomarina aestuarii]|uniref:Adenine DNA glycosylase n=1 Tax=Pseudidiomarina aestuarii TaxID=624146 RepID=A0A7Z6ZSX8_9GAMM|nr:A/G-specific adenine glycosylase [Pseudidiomarina aestuarii]RUO40652.1 A/G-specific adenine glycosylase [Pseudidiomarina aestuarii]
MSHKLSTFSFVESVNAWQQQHGRHQLPWQLNVNPYKVLVSEIMLQQTQVATVIPYFERWMQNFPTVEALAQATEDQVLNCWQGLGYYSRARNLRRAALYITAELAGQIPADIEELRKIPGIGPYTAGAILSFAFNQRGVIVDGNVKRLFARYFGIRGAVNSTAFSKTVWAYAEAVTPTQDNRRFAQGLLDLGSTVCKPRLPLCDACPLRPECFAWAHNQVESLPERSPKKTIPKRTGHFVWDYNSEGLLLEQRNDTSVWPKLWALPEIDTPTSTAKSKGEFHHQFSHYKLHACIWHSKDHQSDNKQSRFTVNQLDTVGLPAPMRKFIESALDLNAEES